MDLLSIAILLQLKCVYFCCPVNRAQARASIFMGLVLGGEIKASEQNICKQIEFLCLLSSTQEYLILRGTGPGGGVNGH